MNGQSKTTLVLVGIIGVLVGALIVAVALPGRRAPASDGQGDLSPAASAPSPTTPTVDVTGSWVCDEPQLQQKWEFMLVQSGAQVTGTRRQIMPGVDNPVPISTGIIQGDRVDILCETVVGSVRYRGRIEGNRIVGADYLPGGKVLDRTFVKE